MPGYDNSMGIGSLLGGFLKGKGEGQTQAVRDSYLQAQKGIIDQEGKLKKLELDRALLEDQVLKTMSPEDQMKALFKTGGDGAAMIEKMNQGNQPGSAPDTTGQSQPFGGGTEQFPIKVPEGGWGLSGRIAESNLNQMQQKSISITDDGKVRATYERPRTHPIRNIRGAEGGPVTITENEFGERIPGSAIHQYVKPDMVDSYDPVTKTRRKVWEYAPGTNPEDQGAPHRQAAPSGGARGGAPQRVPASSPGLAGRVGEGILTEPAEQDKPMSTIDAFKWTDGKGGRGKTGMTANEAKRAGLHVEEKSMTPEQGGKLAMLQQGVKDIEEVQDWLFPKGKKYDYWTAVGSSLGLPGSKHQMIGSRIQNAINGKLRAETGAQANPDELKSMTLRFAPTWKDGGQSAWDKLERLNEFLKYAIVTVDTSGRYKVAYPERLPPLKAWPGESMSFSSPPIGQPPRLNGRKSAADYDE